MVDPASQFLPESALTLLQQLFGSTARRAPTELIPAATNLVVRLRLRDESYAVRVPGSTTGDLAIDRRSECAALEAAVTVDLAPRVVACDPTSGILVTRWIEGETWTSSRAREPDAIRRMAGALRTLHALPVPTAVRSLAPQPLLERYWRIVTNRAGPWRSSLAPLHERITALAQGLHAEPLVLCHSDLHHRNLIEDDRLRLLDWEYAGVTERAYDLASFSQSNDLTRAEQELLLDAYGVADGIEQRFNLHCVVFDWICVLWLVAVNAQKGTHERQRLQLLAQRAKASLESIVTATGVI